MYSSRYKSNDDNDPAHAVENSGLRLEHSGHGYVVGSRAEDVVISKAGPADDD
jgi:hypothetical protein